MFRIVHQGRSTSDEPGHNSSNYYRTTMSRCYGEGSYRMAIEMQKVGRKEVQHPAFHLSVTTITVEGVAFELKKA